MRNQEISAINQKGVVLVTGLVFLVMMTILGVTAMQNTVLEERMAGNLRDENLAFQAAEAALREGERFLEQITLPAFNGSDGLYHHASSPAPDPMTWTGWTTSGKTTTTTITGAASQPRYIIEQLVSVPFQGTKGSAQQSPVTNMSNMYRVIARGVGGTDSAVVVLQSIYRR